MTRKIVVLFVVFVLGLIAQTASLNAQTIHSKTNLNSITWTWTNQQQGVPPTTLVTPSVDSDYLITEYASSPDITANDLLAFFVSWTDDIGPQVHNALTGACSDGVAGPISCNDSFVIHAKANTSIIVQTTYQDPDGPFTYSYTLGRIKLNP